MNNDPNLLKGTVSLLVLKLLQEDDMYGYQMIKTLRQRSSEAFQLNEGALYPVLHKLEKDGQVLSYWEDMGVRKRKYYHITKEGVKALQEKRESWASFTHSMNMILD